MKTRGKGGGRILILYLSHRSISLRDSLHTHERNGVGAASIRHVERGEQATQQPQLEDKVESAGCGNVILITLFVLGIWPSIEFVCLIWNFFGAFKSCDRPWICYEVPIGASSLGLLGLVPNPPHQCRNRSEIVACPGFDAYAEWLFSSGFTNGCQ